MKRFARLFMELDRTNRTGEKVAALESYFREADPRDAAWALYFLCGNRLPRTVTSTALRDWAAEEAGLPAWMLDECYEAVGDLAETLALLLPESGASPLALPLHELISQRLLPMGHMDILAKREMLVRTWRELNATERFLWNKLITGGFRVGVAQTLVIHALAAVAGVEQPVMAHRLMGKWKPTVDDFHRLIRGGNSGPEPETAKPYPFYLASPLEGDPAQLGGIEEWLFEWKWDGIRAQVIRRGGETLIWSRGDEMVTSAFPEIAEAAMALPEGTVVDGEILAWGDGDMPQPFARLQRRLGRKQAGAKVRREFPVVFLAYDLLEWKSEDWRTHPLGERRRQLETVIADAARSPVAAISGIVSIGETLELFPQNALRFPLRISPLLEAKSWDELAAMQRGSRALGVEGVMIKRLDAPYGTGRQRGNMWKWKIDPLVIDAVLIAAQAGHGRRASLYTDYTFGVWQDGKLVPIAKAYSGLDDAEIQEVDKFVRANATGKFGPVRPVKPALVFELAFEAVQESSRHKTGLAVRFPRINRWRRDKKPEDADTLDNLRQFLRPATAPATA